MDFNLIITRELKLWKDNVQTLETELSNRNMM